MNDEKTFGDIIDSTQDEFKVFCADKDLGYLKSLNVLFAQTYTEVVAVKDGLLKKINDSHLEKNSPEHEAVKNLFSVLFRIEGKSIIVSNIIKERDQAFKQEQFSENLTQ